MKNKNLVIPVLFSLSALATSTAVQAAGTAANTLIENTASISYSVGGVSQTDIESSESGNSVPGSGSATTFLVDKKIDLLMTAGSGVNVIPGSTAQAITFTLKNEGNSTETFSFDAPTQVTTGDQFDTSSCTTPANVSLAADASTTVTVNCNIPASSGTVTNGATSQVDLKANIAGGVTQSTGADDPDAVETVFADNTGTTTDGADRNGSHSAVNTYTVATADLSVAKTSAVTKMTINGTDVTTNPKRIPGATIEYTITVSNAVGASTATGIVITDVLPTNMTYVSSTVTHSDGTTGLTASHSSGTVTSDAISLDANETATLVITATIN